MTAQPAAEKPEARRSRRGLRRGSLTPELIVSESLRLLDTRGLDGFSLPKLGRALGADQTAVYRHFPSKDDLVLAIADRLLEESMIGLVPQECWVETLRDNARRLRRTYLAHPAAASMSAYRTTQRPAELRIVDVFVGAMIAAGFEGAEAALMYRAVGDFALSWAGFEATFLSLDERLQETDRHARTQAYLAVSPAQYPSIWRMRTELPDVDDDAIFETILSLVMSGMLERAPHGCGCAVHAGGAELQHIVTVTSGKPGFRTAPAGAPPGGLDAIGQSGLPAGEVERGADDAVGVDAVVAVDVLQRA